MTIIRGKYLLGADSCPVFMVNAKYIVLYTENKWQTMPVQDIPLSRCNRPVYNWQESSELELLVMTGLTMERIP
jgi:hypothetical protein